MEGHSRTPRDPQKRRERHLVSGWCEQGACRGHPPRLRDHEAPSGQGWPAVPTPATAWPGMTVAWPWPVGAPGGPVTTQDPLRGSSQTRESPRTLNKLVMTLPPEGHRLFLSTEVVSVVSVLEPQQLSCRDGGRPPSALGTCPAGCRGPRSRPGPGTGGWGLGAVPSWGRTKPRGPLLPTLPFSCTAPRLAWPT